MGRHSDSNSSVSSVSYLPALIVTGMLCVTTVITVMVLAGAADVLGSIASAAFLGWAFLTFQRIKRS